MRTLSFVSLSAVLASGVLLVAIPVAGAQSASIGDHYLANSSASSSVDPSNQGEPYFDNLSRATAEAASSSRAAAASSAAAIRLGYPYAGTTTYSKLYYAAGNQGQVNVSINPDRGEANPGDVIRYWIRVKSASDQTLPSWKIAFFYDQGQMRVIDPGGGSLSGDHVLWTVPGLTPNEERVYSVRVSLKNNLAPGDRLRTYASMVLMDGSITPACSENDLFIMSKQPVTGAGDGADPVENLRAFLTPVSSAAAGSPIGLEIWFVIGIAGVAVGGRLAKSFI